MNSCLEMAFLKIVVVELERQSHTLAAIKNLFISQSKLLQADDFAHFLQTNNEKLKLLERINGQHKKILDFKKSWCKFKGNIPEETRTKVKFNIEEILHTVNFILRVVKKTFGQMKGECLKSLEN
ncbi:MAG: hypothetical protein ACE5HS_17535 [bacterium]